MAVEIKNKFNLSFSPLSKAVIITSLAIIFAIIISTSYESYQARNSKNAQELHQAQNYNSGSVAGEKTTPSLPPQGTPNPDPIVNCGPGVNSKQTVRDKQSNCKNYVDCGLYDAKGNIGWTMILKSECDKKHAEVNNKNNPPLSWSNIPQSTYRTVSIPCTTVYGNYTSYGGSYEEAQKYCSDLQAEGLRLKAQNEQSLNQYTYSSPTPTNNQSSTPVDYTKSCQEKLNNALHNAQIIYGANGSAYDMAVWAYKNDVYPRCVETGVWRE
jgi:hypothetical protein